MAHAFIYSIIGWVLISAPLHLAWEALHVRLYTLWHEAGTATVVYSVLHCTAGDVFIAAAAFAIAAAVTRNRDWPWCAWRLGVPVLLASGLAYTAASEWINVYRLQRWAYAPDMPVIAGIGVTPLAQWLVVPLVVFWIYRRLFRAPFAIHRLGLTKGELK